MRPVRFVIIGCGMISNYHIAAIRALPEAELAGVCGHTYEKTAEFARQHGTAAYDGTDAVWADPSVDAVCVCTPSGLHAAIALEAIAHGKHVLLEKPLALSLEDCDRVIAAAKERGVLAGVVSQLRFSPAVRQVKRAMEQKVLGRLLCADLYMKYHRSQAYYDTGAWRGTKAMDGGGALMNQGIHGVDLLRYLAGPVKSVYARARTLARNIEVEDTLSAVTEFENGALGVIQATTGLYSGFSRRLELCGEAGTIILEEDRILLWDVADDKGLPHDEDGGMDVLSSSDPTRIGNAGHRRQLANFAAAVQGREKLLVDAAEGRKALEIILSAYRSASEDRPVPVGKL